MSTVRAQRTIGKEISFSGIGLHTGQEVQLKMCPSAANTGLFFQRVDLPGKPLISASVDNVTATARSTTIGCENASVQTVEHVLAAIAAYEIDNLIIQLTASEPPVADGSSSAFVKMIEEAGIVEQDAEVHYETIEEPIFFSHGETQLVALPSSEYRISYTLHYPHSPLIGSQFYSLIIDRNSFKNELSMCRTFALYEELTHLKEKGLIKGGSLDNAVLIKENQVMNESGLRFNNEMVRHKILDVVGDLSLIRYPFKAHVIALRSGHASNVAFGKKICEYLKRAKTAKTAKTLNPAYS